MSKTEIELNNFFIFNSKYGPNEEDEHKKILFYYPETDSADVQIKNVGLVEAIIQFTNTFKPSETVSSLHTQKKRQLYFQPEKDFWMVMTLNIPCIDKIKENSNYPEYLEEDVQDNVYGSVLQQAYNIFRLFNGNFVDIMKNNLSVLMNKFKVFFPDYLLSLKLAHSDLLNIFNGIQFLPLDKETFVSVQCFINLLESKYSIVKHTAFLYNEHLVWSGIEPEDMQVVYQYLVSNLIPLHVKSELTGGSIPRHQTPFAALHHGRFITGPSDLKSVKTIENVPIVYLHKESNLKKFYMVVYRALSASVCLFIDGDTELTLDLFKELDDFISPNLTTIVSEIAEYCFVMTPSNISEFSPRFIYFNKLNLAYKSTVHLDNKQTGNLACTKESIKIMADMNSRRPLLGHAGETIVKTMNDYWIVGKFSNLREFYVALQQKNASLIDISNEITKLCETELKGIFFHST